MYIRDAQSRNQAYGYDHDVWKTMYTTFETMINELQIKKKRYTATFANTIEDIHKYAKAVNDYLSYRKN